MDVQPLLSDDYLFSLWQTDFERHCASGADAQLLQLLTRWHDRAKDRTETQLQSQFIDVFFKTLWGYWGTGQSTSEEGYCLDAQYAVPGAGERGGTGAADLALGWWGRGEVAPVAQALCEFKDIRADLDAPQKRKGNTRSPVRQCFDYLKHEFDRTESRITPKPTWGIVTDMNEFRLYARTAGDSTCQRFCVKYQRRTTDEAGAALDLSSPALGVLWLLPAACHSSAYGSRRR